MDFLRKHWFDIGGVLAVLVLSYIWFNRSLSIYNLVVWISLLSLFLHQLEEYRIVGTFPGMINRVMYHSKWYNAGMVTCILFFLPCIYLFFKTISVQNLATASDYYFGIALGIICNILGVLKMIDWLADKNSPYHFEQRNLLPQDRTHN